MNRLILATAALCACGTYQAFGADKEGADAPKPPPPPVELKKDGPDKGRGNPRMQTELSEITRICGLTEEQQKKLLEISEARVKAMQELMDKSAEQISAMLTPEQRVKWNEGIVMELVRREFRKVSFSDDQVVKIKAEIAAQTGASLFMMNEKNIQKVKDLMTFVKDKILTEEQKMSMREPPKFPGAFGQPEGNPKMPPKMP